MDTRLQPPKQKTPPPPRKPPVVVYPLPKAPPFSQRHPASSAAPAPTASLR